MKHLLKRRLQPTDFENCDLRVGDWSPYPHYGNEAYRIWICEVDGHWFQRHEWKKVNKNQTEWGNWVYNGMSARRKFKAHEHKLKDHEEYLGA